VLAIVNSIVIICPTVAPLLGSLIMNFTNWRGIFFVQAGFGLIVLLFSIIYSETLPEPSQGNPLVMMSRLFVVLKNPGFLTLLITFSVGGASSLAYTGSSAYIYQDFYGQGNFEYSIFFGVNAAFMMAGPFLYLLLSERIRPSRIITGCLALCVVSGMAIICFSGFGPYAFSASLILTFVALSCSKPPSVNMMLDMQKKDTGSAASLINSAGLGLGTAGIALTSLPLLDPPRLLGAICVVLAAASLTLWLAKGRKYVEQKQN